MWLSFVRSNNCSSLYLMNSLILCIWVCLFVFLISESSIHVVKCMGKRREMWHFFSECFSVLVVANNLLASGLR